MINPIKAPAQFTPSFYGQIPTGGFFYSDEPIPSSITYKDSIGNDVTIPTGSVVVTSNGGLYTFGTSGSYNPVSGGTISTIGIISMNGLSGTTQVFAIGNSGSNINIISSGNTHTFNIPTASGTVRGVLSTVDYNKFDTAYNWGNHSSAGYLVSGSTTTTNIPEGSNLYFTNDRAISAVGITPGIFSVIRVASVLPCSTPYNPMSIVSDPTLPAGVDNDILQGDLLIDTAYSFSMIVPSNMTNINMVFNHQASTSGNVVRRVTVFKNSVQTHQSSNTVALAANTTLVSTHTLTGLTASQGDFLVFIVEDLRTNIAYTNTGALKTYGILIKQ